MLEKLTRRRKVGGYVFVGWMVERFWNRFVAVMNLRSGLIAGGLDNRYERELAALLSLRRSE